MSAVVTLDDVARTSDDAAVRARFDAATLTALRFFSLVFLFVSFPHLAEARTVFRVLLSVIAVLVAVALMLAVRKKAKNRLAQFVRRAPRGTAMVVLIVEAALLMMYNANSRHEAMVVIAVMAPMIAMFFRLLPAEHVLLHASLSVVLVIVAVFFGNSGKSVAPPIAGQTFANGAALTVALLVSRRWKRTVTAEWTERRASAREQIRMRDELRYARELQLSMLPERAPALDWADICSVSIPASEVGGDYYDYFVAPDHMALVCGDVAGHGMASGLVLAALRGGFALLRDTLRDPAHVLERLHDVVTQTTRRRMLVTISIVLLDRVARRVIIASAGHPPVLVRRANGLVEAIELYAPPLGVRLPLNVPQREFAYDTGDVFVLHSDGIYEARNASDESYGFERLQRVVSENGDQTAETIRDAILSDVATFRGAVEQDDDMTIVVCRML
jgi:serine phosphatase RsbU (regulator of sigma subunit)